MKVNFYLVARVRAMTAMETKGLQVKPTTGETPGDGVPKPNYFSNLLDTLVAVHWELSNGSHNGGALPGTLADHLRRVDGELEAAIIALKTYIREQDLSL